MRNNVNVPKKRFFFGLFLFAICFLYFCVYINKMFPFQEGWYTNYDMLIKAGNKPYKDFFYYLPPLNLLIDHILLFLSGNVFIIYKFFRLFERLLLIEAMYILLTRYYNCKYVWFACFVGGIVGASQQFELMGDYNQTGQLLFVLLAYTAARYAESESFVEQKKWLFLFGIITGLQFTLKQTYFVSACIVYFIVLTVTCLKKRNRYYFLYCLYTFFGMVIPIGVCFAWLALNGSITEFINQVYMTDAKGGLFEILVASVFIVIQRNYIYISIAALLLITIFFLWKNCHKKFDKYNLLLFSLLLISLISAAASLFSNCFVSLYNSFVDTDFLWKFVLIAVVIADIMLFSFFYEKKFPKKLFDYLFFSFGLLSFIAVGVLFYMDYKGVASSVFLSTPAFSFASTGAAVMCFFVVALCFIIGLFHYCSGEANAVAYPVLMVFSCAVAVCYSSLMTAKDYVVSSTCWITVPLLLTVGLSAVSRFNRTKLYCIVMLSLVVTSTCLAQKVTCAYSWWGWSDEPLAAKTESINHKLLKGYKFSAKEKNLYEKTIKIIDNNTSEKSTILGFPHITIFNVLTNHTKIDWFVPVLFYDTCSDRYAEKAAELLEKTPPDIVIWCDMPGCMETHESIFREGNLLGQRKIQDWFIDVKERKYSLVGQIENLFIYKLKGNGVKSSYKYIQNQDAVNSTATK